MAEIKDENGRKERFFLFYDGESVSGKVESNTLLSSLTFPNDTCTALRCR